jgi:4-hydroxybenzoate polyprenyltransferase
MPTVKNYLSLIKFSHSIFAMPFAMIGFFLGAYWLPMKNLKENAIAQNYAWSIYIKFPIITFLLIILCMVFARSAAMSFNRYLDRNFDAKNPRTAIREIPKGIISAKNALTFTIISCILFVTACFVFICHRLH